MGEIQELEATREALRGDLTILERHVDEQRSRLQASISELHRLLDDPHALRVEQPAGLSEASAPTVSGPADTAGSSDAGDAPPRTDAPAAAPRGETSTPDAGSAPEAAPTPQASAGRIDGPPPSLADPTPTPPVAADTGPPTHAIDVIDVADTEGDEDAFLAELRKAMTDDEPLGPREPASPGSSAPSALAHDELEHQRLRSRFGRRR